MLSTSMGKYVTVSVKIPRDVKEKLERAGVSPSKVMKDALIEALKEIELKELKREVDELDSILAKVSVDRIVRSVRENRER